MQLDDLDRTATTVFEGYVVRKDLVRTFSRQFPVPTYVVEFLLGRYCATTDEAEIQEGLDIVQRQLGSRTVKAGEEDLFKAHARESGSVKIIDIITARLDARTDSYVATLPSLRLTDVRLTPAMVTDNERMLTGGFYAEMTLSYDASIAQEKLPVACRRQLFDLSDEMATKLDIEFYQDGRDALLKALVD